MNSSAQRASRKIKFNSITETTQIKQEQRDINNNQRTNIEIDLQYPQVGS